MAKLRQVGNSTGVTIGKKYLEIAGFSEGETIVIEASEGQLTLRKADNLHTKAMASLDRCMTRYDTTLKDLAK